MRINHPIVLVWAVASSTFALSVPAVAASLYNTGSENVSGSRNTPQYTDNGKTYGPFGWNFSYTRSFDGKQLKKDVEIDFVFDADIGFNDEQKTAYRATVEKNIEGIWNNKYVIADMVNNMKFPILVDVTTSDPFNQTVKVHKGSGRADMTNWYLSDSASVNAHEFGHMLGLFDEYIGGAVDRYPNPTLSDTGLMGLGALNPNPTMLPRYYQQYVDYISSLNSDKTFKLVAVGVPEPNSILGIGIFCGLSIFFKFKPCKKQQRQNQEV
jgi:hypothetical protein